MERQWGDLRTYRWVLGDGCVRRCVDGVWGPQSLLVHRWKQRFEQEGESQSDGQSDGPVSPPPLLATALHVFHANPHKGIFTSACAQLQDPLSCWDCTYAHSGLVHTVTLALAHIYHCSSHPHCSITTPAGASSRRPARSCRSPASSWATCGWACSRRWASRETPCACCSRGTSRRIHSTQRSTSGYST